jgi:tripartite-type tricarboxylate transporter receptor subunit TctC
METMTRITRRQLVQWGGASAFAALVPPAAWAQADQLEIARLVIGSPPGGVLDAFTRLAAEVLRPDYARNVVVENKTGASGQIAVQTVKAAVGDGATILVTPMPMMGIYPHTYKKLAYNPRTDFVPVSMGAVFDLTLAVGPMVPASVKDLRGFFAWCKANPEQASFGSPAAGSTPHFIGSMAAKAAGVELAHVSYRGPTPAINDMIGGQVAAACSTVGDFLPFLDGKARLLATTGTERSRFTPQVPTFIEQGYKDLVVNDWFGLFAPAGTPDKQVQRLSTALKKGLADRAFARAMDLKGVDPRWSSSVELAERLEADTRRWGPIVKSLNFSADS